MSALLRAMASSRSCCSWSCSLLSLSCSSRSLSRLAHSSCWFSLPNWSRDTHIRCGQRRRHNHRERSMREKQGAKLRVDANQKKKIECFWIGQNVKQLTVKHNSTDFQHRGKLRISKYSIYVKISLGCHRQSQESNFESLKKGKSFLHSGTLLL